MHRHQQRTESARIVCTETASILTTPDIIYRGFGVLLNATAGLETRFLPVGNWHPVTRTISFTPAPGAKRDDERQNRFDPNYHKNDLHEGYYE